MSLSVSRESWTEIYRVISFFLTKPALSGIYNYQGYIFVLGHTLGKGTEKSKMSTDNKSKSTYNHYTILSLIPIN